MNKQYNLENKHLNIVALERYINETKDNDKIDLMNLEKADLSFIARGIETMMYVEQNIKTSGIFNEFEMTELINDILKIEKAWKNDKYN